MKIAAGYSRAGPFFAPLVDRINMLRAAGNGSPDVMGLAVPDFSEDQTGLDSLGGWLDGSAGNFSLTPAAAEAPDGTTTATKLVANTTNSFHAITQGTTRSALVPIKYRLSIFAKQAGYTRLKVEIGDTNGANAVHATFDLAGGQVGVAIGTTGSGWTAGAAAIKELPDGWYRCTIDGTSGTANNVRAAFLIDNGSGTGASSTSFAGNNVNGVYLWRCNLLPAAAWDIGGRVFHDDFSSSGTVDLANTRAAGFNWYLQNEWPASGSVPWETADATQSGDVSVAAGVMTLLNDRSTFGQVVHTAASDGGGGYVGRAFTLPAYFEASATWDPDLALGTPGSAPLFWTVSLEFLLGTATRFAENDIFEANDGSGLPEQVLHDWMSNTVLAGNAAININADMAANVIPFQQVYSNLWLTQAANGGTWGYVQKFFNGIATPSGDVAYRSGGDSNPTSGLSGFISSADSHSHVLILGCGGISPAPTWPCSFSSVSVFK